MKDSMQEYIINIFPLIYILKMYRSDCEQACIDADRPIPIKSACWNCWAQKRDELKALSEPLQLRMIYHEEYIMSKMPKNRKKYFLFSTRSVISHIDYGSNDLDIFGFGCDNEVCGT